MSIHRPITSLAIVIVILFTTQGGNAQTLRERIEARRQQRNQTSAIAGLPPKGTLSTAQKRTLQSGGLTREYLIQQVTNRTSNDLHPVVIVLHGGTETDEQVWTQTSLPTLGAQEGFLVVAPNAIGKHWNDGRGATLGGSGASTADDLGFLKQLIADVIAHDGGDPSAIFMVGASNGGFMTLRFACEAGSLLRAGGNVISELYGDQPQTCKPSHALPWIAINGDKDPIVPFAGEPAGTVKNGQTQPALLSASDSFAFLARQAGCREPEIVTQLPDRNPADNSTAERHVRSGCQGGGTSSYYILHNAGHCWPGLEVRPLVARFLGGVNEDIDSGTVIWEHFRQFIATR